MPALSAEARAATRETRSTCPYCGVGCGVLIAAEGGRITGVRGDPKHPANFGRLCTKGSTLHLTASPAIAPQVRLLHPERRETRGQPGRRLGWGAALDEAADRFAGIVTAHGPDAVGFYGSGQLLTEDYYVFNKLAKGLVGTNNMDTNSRLCMSSAVAGYKQTLGADAPPACYEDVDHADCLFIVGSNTAWAHPILFRRIEDAKRARPQMKIVVVDPRRTDTCELADLHLPLQPGTDVLLFHGLLHLMLWEGWTKPDWIAAHTQGFDALKVLVRDATPERVAQACGLEPAALLEAARLFATSGATLSLYCMGLNQSSSGTAKNAALVNLHLATAQIGRPGAGPFSLTGQPNAMGGREVGGLSNLLSAHRDLADPVQRAEVAALWGLPDVPAQPGLSAVELFEAAADGQVKALWIACTNPAQSMPSQAAVRRGLQRAEFVVVQEAYATTATCAFADLLLPATSWGEKIGTVTNSERRISRVRPAVPPPGEARHDWAIAADFGRRLEARLPRRREGTLFPYADDDAGAEQIWNEHRASTAGRDLDISGLSWALLDAQGPQQWPFPAGADQGRARLYADGRFATADGRARFVATPYRPVHEARDARFPFSLNTGRLRDQWHGMSRTGTIGRLFGHVPEPAVQMNPQDMARRAIREGDWVAVASRRGSVVLPAQADAGLGAGQVFIAMHWGPEFIGGRGLQGEALIGVNAVTDPTFCPSARQPELKHAAVRVSRVELPWSLLGMAWMPGERLLSVRESLRALMPEFGYACCLPFSSGGSLAQGATERSGLLFRAAATAAVEPALLARIEALLGLDVPGALRYDDPRRGQRRVLRLARAGTATADADGGEGRLTDDRLDGVLLAGDTRAEAWIRTLLQSGAPAQAYGTQLLRSGATPPKGVESRGRVICSCFGVDETAISRTLQGLAGDEPKRLASLQARLQCGTNCGSCIPELQRLVRQVSPAPEPSPT